jgi:hypothetical protein
LACDAKDRFCPPHESVSVLETEARGEPRQRRAANAAKLAVLGWEVLIVWQCETRDVDSLWLKLRGFLKGSKRDKRRSGREVSVNGDEKDNVCDRLRSIYLRERGA